MDMKSYKRLAGVESRHPTVRDLGEAVETPKEHLEAFGFAKATKRAVKAAPKKDADALEKEALKAMRRFHIEPEDSEEENEFLSAYVAWRSTSDADARETLELYGLKKADLKKIEQGVLESTLTNKERELLGISAPRLAGLVEWDAKDSAFKDFTPGEK